MDCSLETTPLVSVLVPVYNAEEYLRRCLDSILGQSYENIEVVVIDDGSSDGSAGVLAEYEQAHPQVVKVTHQDNAGVAKARNRAIKQATGDYLMFIDNDDFFDADYIETFVTVASEQNAQVVCGGFKRPDKNNHVVAEIRLNESTDWMPYAIGAAWAKIYRTSFIKENAFTFLPAPIMEDLFFTLPAIALADKVSVIPYCGYNWFYNAQSVSNTNHKSSQGLKFFESLDAMRQMTIDRGIGDEPIVRHYLIRLIVWFLFYTCKKDGKSVSTANCSECRRWLNENIPQWKDDSLATPFKPAGDGVFNRISVWLFVRHPGLYARALGVYRIIG